MKFLSVGIKNDVVEWEKIRKPISTVFCCCSRHKQLKSYTELLGARAFHARKSDNMKRKLLDNGNIWQKSDGRWIGLVRYKDEFGVTQRKSFSSKKKKTLQAKMTEYVKKLFF